MAKNSPSWICKSVPQTPAALTLIYTNAKTARVSYTVGLEYNMVPNPSLKESYQNIVFTELGKLDVDNTKLSRLGVSILSWVIPQC